MADIKDVLIIGSGPAGLTCSIYASRSGLNSIVIAGDTPGGQLVHTDVIENFPGFNSVSGADLMMKMIEQAEKAGGEIVFDMVSSVEKNTNSTFKVSLASGEDLVTRTILVAIGVKHRYLCVPGEDEFTNKGVSWCATCDGPMYKGKKAAVVGGGNTALMEALFLSNFAQEVYLIHRRDTFRADKLMQSRVLSNPKIKIIWNSKITQIVGDIRLTHVILNDEEKLEINGLFIAIGAAPSSDFIKSMVKCDEEGYIKAHETVTSCEGIFAAGDVVTGALKQAIYAAGQGALALNKIEEYLGVR